jgi:hypothetical protein
MGPSPPHQNWPDHLSETLSNRVELKFSVHCKDVALEW